MLPLLEKNCCIGIRGSTEGQLKSLARRPCQCPCCVIHDACADALTLVPCCFFSFVACILSSLFILYYTKTHSRPLFVSVRFQAGWPCGRTVGRGGGRGPPGQAVTLRPRRSCHVLWPYTTITFINFVGGAGACDGYDGCDGHDRDLMGMSVSECVLRRPPRRWHWRRQSLLVTVASSLSRADVHISVHSAAFLKQRCEGKG